MTYRETVALLRQAGVDSPEWDAALLIEHFCAVDRARIPLVPDRDYSAPALIAAVRARAARRPLQYLIGEWPFYRHTYEITPDCLIPRADTEVLVDAAVRMLPQGAFFADLCTGSGCIAISVLAERPDTTALAVDLSPGALTVAVRNAVKNGVAERFTARHADVLRFSPKEPCPSAILSNPPYIKTDALGTLSPEVRSEPRLALDGGKDGLRFYRALLRIARDWLVEDGFCLFEIGYDQADDLRRMAAENGFSCEIRRDYGGNDRVAELRRTE